MSFLSDLIAQIANGVVVAAGVATLVALATFDLLSERWATRGKRVSETRSRRHASR